MWQWHGANVTIYVAYETSVAFLMVLSGADVAYR